MVFRKTSQPALPDRLSKGDIITTNDVFERYKHLDDILSDRECLKNGLKNQILCDLWQAVKKGAEKTPSSPREEA